MQKIKLILLISVILLSNFFVLARAQAQAEPFIGQIMWTGAYYCPRGWAQADGQLIAIAQNTALFSILGTTYGGNGQTTFALPDLRGRVPLNAGQGTGLTNRTLGEIGGSETVTITVNQIPSHTHPLSAKSEGAASADPAGKMLSKSGTYRTNGTNVGLNPQSIGSTGGGQPLENMPPFLTLRGCIAMEGIFPSHN